jgi:hypothetical protein
MTAEAGYTAGVDPYKVKGKVEYVKGVEILEPGHDQEKGPKYTSIEQLKLAGYTKFRSKRSLIKILSEDDFEGDKEYEALEAWFTDKGAPMFCGMTLDEFVDKFGSENIVVGNPSKDIYTNRIYYDTIAVKVDGHGIGLFQTFLSPPSRNIELKPFTLAMIEQFVE